MRDAYNLFASRNKKAQQQNHGRLKVTPEFVRLWKVFVKEAYGETNFTENKIVINYNNWVTSEDYRTKLSLELGLNPNKDNTNVMTTDGNGSSFDGLKFKGDPGKMDVLGRWKHFQNNPNFMSLFDDEVKELAEKYFDIKE